MIIYPAVDIRGGKCVRLYQGEFDKEKTYAAEPYKMAKKWEAQGAEFLHLVDLDGARSGVPQNIEAVRKIVESVKIPVELGGGIRTIDSLERVLNLGVKRAILGTSLVRDSAFVKEAVKKFGNRIVAGIDARHGKVSVDGWNRTTDTDAIDLAQELESLGIERLIYTDILCDGTLKGINFSGFRDLAGCLDISIIASGGVTTLDDIVKLKELEPMGVDGVIIGKALYEGVISLKGAIDVARS
jgi:phosphoribosylformimino-5-aminoimidazole carboxamide ribotide isomerase